MGKYTVWDKPIIDATIDEHLAFIADQVVKSVHPSAIILSGSFGRGEGSVRVNGTQLDFLSDYEIGVVTTDVWKRFRLDQVSAQIEAVIPVKTTLYWVTPRRLRDNRVKNFSLGQQPPSIMMYEMKAGAKILYGSVALHENLIQPESLPIQEGVYLILNRMIELAVNLVHGPNSEQMAFSITKLILACGDALLIRAHAYHFSYEHRACTFQGCYSSFQPIFQDLDFLSLYQAAVAFKLRPEWSLISTVVERRADALMACDAVLQYLATTEMGFSSDSYLEWTENYLAYCGRKRVAPLYTAGPLPIPDILYENLICALKLLRSGRRFRLSALYSDGKCWPQMIYAVIPPLFFAIPWRGGANRVALESVRQWPARLVVERELPSTDDWKPLAQLIYDLWRAIC